MLVHCRPETRSVTRRILQREGYVVVTAANGSEATAMLRREADADGMSQEWRVLAAGLGGKQRAAALVLVTSRFSFDDAQDATALKVAGVIVKPFRSEQHSSRLLDLALRQAGIRTRRLFPRFTIPESAHAELGLSWSGGEDVFPLKNISEEGATIDLSLAHVGSLFDTGSFFPLATLSWGDVQLEAAIDVIHSDSHSAGIRFSRIFKGAPRFLRALKERQEVPSVPTSASGERGGTSARAGPRSCTRKAPARPSSPHATER